MQGVVNAILFLIVIIHLQGCILIFIGVSNIDDTSVNWIEYYNK